MEALQTHTLTVRMTRRGHEWQEDLLSRERPLWNIDRTRRIKAHQEEGKSLSYSDQCRMLTAMRAADPVLASFSADATRSILARSDKAFRRFRAGKGGFPRAKGMDSPVRSFDAFQFRIRPCGNGHAILIKGFPPFRVDNVPEGEIRCANCGLVLHRDVNAACVIRDRGFPPEPGGNADAAPGGFADAKTVGGCCRGAEPLGGGPGEKAGKIIRGRFGTQGDNSQYRS